MLSNNPHTSAKLLVRFLTLVKRQEELLTVAKNSTQQVTFTAETICQNVPINVNTAADITQPTSNKLQKKVTTNNL